MFDWCFDRLEKSANWLAADLKRTHVAMLFLDCLVVFLCWINLSDIFLLFGQTQDLLIVPRGKTQWVLGGLCLPVLHCALTPWGQRWVKSSVKSFSVVFLTVAVGGASLGVVVTDYARTQAIAAGYRSCDQTFLNDFQRDDEKLVAPGVLCPPSSSTAKPYPPLGADLN
ncbi:hypothetical protein SAMN04488518_1223 [Pseudovibrio ascidiaceicola]|uniref:Uncharacterized protein n=1 Tax=Pseudovibrio ascidiaceicola TaxID=285279 RepID=A0A1I4FTN8_9HYPH|nr:hypothetical protein [Pseudovibrio ascidiaceicola]SFL20660.1 hypothetical protein SAMN04488518_1223 [Pseudovibrio ascidiaceicola]